MWFKLFSCDLQSVANPNIICTHWEYCCHISPPGGVQPHSIHYARPDFGKSWSWLHTFPRSEENPPRTDKPSSDTGMDLWSNLAAYSWQSVQIYQYTVDIIYLSVLHWWTPLLGILPWILILPQVLMLIFEVFKYLIKWTALYIYIYIYPRVLGWYWSWFNNKGMEEGEALELQFKSVFPRCQFTQEKPGYY